MSIDFVEIMKSILYYNLYRYSLILSKFIPIISKLSDFFEIYWLIILKSVHFVEIYRWHRKSKDNHKVEIRWFRQNLTITSKSTHWIKFRWFCRIRLILLNTTDSIKVDSFFWSWPWVLRSTSHFIEVYKFDQNRLLLLKSTDFLEVDWLALLS